MTTTTTRTTAPTTRSLDAVLLSRRGAVYLPAGTSAGTRVPAPRTLAGVTLLETDLVGRGFLVSAGLRAALTALDDGSLAATGATLLADIDAELGADRDHTPLFRDFPASTPTDPLAFYVDRVLSLGLQEREQPCVLCGTAGTVHPVAPCAHLVCRSCFDGADFSACPICHRRVDPADPFLRPAAVRPAASPHRALPARLRVLTLGGDADARLADARAELAALLARTGALGPQDSDDLAVLLGAVGDRTALAWLPGEVPARETKARVLAWLLADPAHFPVALPAVVGRLTTATDVLRLLAVRSGGDPGLVEAVRLAPVARPLRRALLRALDGLDPLSVTEDMRRRPGPWKRAGERLHPFEHARRFPRAALAFAALRELRLTDDALSIGLRASAAAVPGADTEAERVRVPVWAARVEAALAAADLPTALRLLGQRPGELVRRTDHLLVLAGPDGADPVVAALGEAVHAVAPAVLLSALGALRSRTAPHETRVFFPKGPAAQAHVATDGRVPLDGSAVARTVAVLTDEVLRRAAGLPPVDTAVVDAELDGIIAPFAERTASRSLVTLPRGSELTVPPGRTVRLFLHWTESETSGRTDLDLATAMFDADWKHIGTCDYTRLRYAGGAVHSGDLTSAPAPRGASEFVDLDVGELAATGVRYVVAVVYSFNDVPFTELADAFAGLMVKDRPGSEGPAFDPRQVEQRFDLTSPAKACVPLVFDVQAGTMRWLDVVQGVTGTDHAVHRHGGGLADLGRHLTGLFTSGARVTLGELALWHAASRAKTVLVRHADGSTSTYGRRDGEATAEFAARVGGPDDDRAGAAAKPEHAQLAFLLRGDLALPAGAEAYALYPAALDAASVRLVAAPDLVSALAPRTATARRDG
ncbi:MXAN_6230/SCO0854 family RING domain-containing protein [Streptomyces sp. NPDC005576]|uniref:MXAN_6230/SCO0854 family RING domain-containing protein n=1 Tax=unclassified Streptomyces TaxID=2593676 RepID=UPI0033FF273D